MGHVPKPWTLGLLAMTGCWNFGATWLTLHNCVNTAKSMSQEGVSFSFIRERQCWMVYVMDWHLLLDDTSYANEGLKKAHLRHMVTHVSGAFEEVQGSGGFLWIQSQC